MWLPKLMEMRVRCTDHMQLPVSPCRRTVRGLFWMLHQGEKREIQILDIKKELKLTGRGSAMFPWTPAVVHIHKKYFTHTKYTFDQKLSFLPWTKNVSTRGGKKKLYLTTALCFSTFIVLFFLFPSVDLWGFSLSESLTVRSLSRCPSRWDRDSCSPPIRPPTALHLWFPGTTAPGGCTCEGRRS